jgi:hypothetical protein
VDDDVAVVSWWERRKKMDYAVAAMKKFIQ